MRAPRAWPTTGLLSAIGLLLALGPSTAGALTTLSWLQPVGPSGVDEFRVYKGRTTDQGELVWTGLPQADALGIYSQDVQIDEIDQGVPVYVWMTAANEFGESPPSNANVYPPGCAPALDSDCDAIPDDGAPGYAPCPTGQTLGCDDNCPYRSNSGQRDRGGIRVGSAPDGIGDRCQCGDVNFDGWVTSADSVIIGRSLLVPPSATMTRPELCDVGGSPGCSSADAVIVLRAQLTPPSATIVQQCAPALAP